MSSVKKKLIPIITVVVLVLIALVVFIVVSKLPKDSGMVHVQQEYLDGTLLDLGEWKGTLSTINEYFSASIEDLDGLLDAVRNSDFYDEKLEFDCLYGYYSTIIYLVVDGKAFSLQFWGGDHIAIAPLQTIYYDVLFKTDLSRMMYAPVDTWNSRKTDSKTGKYVASEWMAAVSLDDIRYLYSKIDSDMYEITDDAIYAKCYVQDVDEISWELISIDKTDKYGVKIYEDETGKVMVEVLY